jgi:hypothetical protein
MKTCSAVFDLVHVYGCTDGCASNDSTMLQIRYLLNITQIFITTLCYILYMIYIQNADGCPDDSLLPFVFNVIGQGWASIYTGDLIQHTSPCFRKAACSRCDMASEMIRTHRRPYLHIQCTVQLVHSAFMCTSRFFTSAAHACIDRNPLCILYKCYLVQCSDNGCRESVVTARIYSCWNCGATKVAPT